MLSAGTLRWLPASDGQIGSSAEWCLLSGRCHQRLWKASGALGWGLLHGKFLHNFLVPMTSQLGPKKIRPQRELPKGHVPVASICLYPFATAPVVNSRHTIQPKVTREGTSLDAIRCASRGCGRTGPLAGVESPRCSKRVCKGVRVLSLCQG